jgi:hypothetical protein
MNDLWAQGHVDYQIKNKILMRYSKEFMKWVNESDPYQPSFLFSWG